MTHFNPVRDYYPFRLPFPPTSAKIRVCLNPASWTRKGTKALC